MPKFVVEREIPGVGQAPKEAHREGVQKSKAVLRELGPDIQWVESYVTDDKIYCVYIAPNEELIKEACRKGGYSGKQDLPGKHGARSHGGRVTNEGSE